MSPFLKRLFAERPQEQPKESPPPQDGAQFEHRWLEHGETWVKGSNDLDATAELVRLALKRLPTERLSFAVRFKSGWLTGEVYPDLACKDPKAVHRSPYIIEAMFHSAERFSKLGLPEGVRLTPDDPATNKSNPSRID